MGLLDRVSRNLFFKVLGEGCARLVFFLFIIYTARKLGDSDFGKYSYAVTFTGMFLILTDLGLNTLLIRDVAGDRAKLKKYVSHLTPLKFALSIIAFGAMVFLAGRMHGEPEKIRLIQLLGLFTVATTFLEFGFAIFSAVEQMQYEAFLKTTHRLLIAGFGIGALVLGYGLWGLVFGLLAGSLLSMILSWLTLIYKFGKMKLSWNLTFNASLLRAAFPLSLMAVFIVIYYRIDILMLAALRGNDAEIGWYTAAVRLIDAIGVVPALAVSAMLPIFSSLQQDSVEALKRIYEKSFKYLFIAGLAVAVATSLFAEQLIRVLYGEGFLPSIPAIRWLVWAVLFMFVNHILLNLLIVIHRQKLNAISTGLCVLVNIGANWLLIPQYGYLGACAATVLTEFILFTVSFYFVSKYFIKINLVQLTYRSILGGVLMASGIHLFYAVNPWLALGLGTAAFIGTLIVLRDFSRADIQAIQSLVRGVIHK
jgi:O-antigen/teichoic acid export membrane protein